MTDLEKFSRLASSIGQPLSAAFKCPRHSGDNSLIVEKYPFLPGGYFVRCQKSRCGFSGSVLDLAAAASNRTIYDVGALFMPNAPLHGIFFESYGNDAVDRDFIRTEVIRSEEYYKCNEYLLQCKTALLSSHRGRKFLCGQGIKEDMLPKIPCGIPCPNPPDRIAHAIPAKNSDCYLIMPHMVAGKLTDLVLIDMRDGSRTTHHLEKKTRGAFTPISPMSENICLCPSELDTLILMSKIDDVGADIGSPVAIASPDSLTAFPGIKNVVLVGHAGKKLSTTEVMELHRHLPSASISVVELPVVLSQTAPTRIQHIFTASIPFDEWIVSELARTAKTEGSEKVAGQLACMGLSKAEKTILIDALERTGQTSAMLLQEIRSARPACTVATYGSIRIKRAFSGYEEVFPVARQLSNFIMMVNYVTGEGDNKMIALTVKTDRPGCPGYDMALPVSKLKTRNGAEVAHLVWTRLLEAGVSFNPFAASLSDMDWLSVVRMFDHIEYRPQHRMLGVDGTFIRYPKLKLNCATGSVVAAEMPPSLPEIAISSYGALSYPQDKHGCLPSALHAKKDDAVDSFLGIMGHILVETARLARGGYTPRHLVIPYTAPETVTENMLSHMACVLGGSPEIKFIPKDTAECKQFFKSLDVLGGLPVILKAADAVHGFARHLNHLKSSAIVLYPMQYVRGGLRAMNVYYLSEILDQDRFELSTEVLAMIRSEWGSMLHETFSVVPTLDTNIPAVSWMERFCGGAPSESLFSIKPNCEKIEDTVEQFMARLSHLGMIGAITLASSEAEFYSPKRRATDIGFRRGSNIRIQPSALFNIMNANGFNLNWYAVGSELVAKGIWQPLSTKRVMSVELWDSLVSKTHALKIITAKDISARSA